MVGWLGAPTLAKMGIDAAGRLWRRLKNKNKTQGREEDQHAFSSDSLDTIGYTDSNPDTLECLGVIENWVDSTPDTYDVFGAWRHPSEPSSIASFDEEVDLFRSVSIRADAELAETAEPAEPAEPIKSIKPTKPTKPTKRSGIKDVFKNVKAAFKQRDHSG